MAIHASMAYRSCQANTKWTAFFMHACKRNKRHIISFIILLGLLCSGTAYSRGFTIENIENLDLSKARRPLQQQRRVNVDFPTWMIQELDREARRVGVTRQSIIKIWLAERLEHSATNKAFNPDTGEASSG